MTQPKVALVVPTIREDSFKQFYQRWDALGLFDRADLILMEDNPTQSFSVGNKVRRHLAWRDIERELANDAWIVPRRSDTVRSFAYWFAWNHEVYDYVMTLDDDCYPPTAEDGVVYKSASELVDGHIFWLTNRTRWMSTLTSARPRGIPYKNLGQTKNVVVNHGLWTNVLDYDAITQLGNPTPERHTFSNVVVPHGTYFPMCGMNVMWRRDVTVLMYHLLMGQQMLCGKLSPLPFDRFGDIWCGIIAKKLCDVSGLCMSTGTPYIRHERASDPFANLRKEAHGVGANEQFWELVDSFNLRSTEHSLETKYHLLGHHIATNADKHPALKPYVDYFGQLGHAMKAWAVLFGAKNLVIG